jgi:hexosaminidase
VPKPVELLKQQGEFLLNEKVKIEADQASMPAAKILANSLEKAIGKPVVVASKGNGQIKLKVDPTLSDLGDEGYRLHVTDREILIVGSKYAGVFNGVQTLRQLLPASSYAAGASNTSRVFSVPCVQILDRPSYPWRGLMLDVSRQFLDKKYVLHYLDVMAEHKLNQLHMHLTDDCGWRVEIKKYPKLTEIGSMRGEGEKREGGFYTQDDIREMVAYAADRNITIIPEIEIPAHALASIVAYPWLSCTGVQHKVPDHHFISKDLYCPSKETTWKFLDEVLTEVCELFPSKYIHIGGDEAVYDKWKTCTGCQAKIKELGLKGEHELQGWMTREVEQMLQKKGRKIIGWEEILKCGVTKNTAIMPWHDAKSARNGAKAGNPVVQAVTAHCYFDAPESKLPGELPGARWIPPTTLMNAYSWSPTPDGLTPEQEKNVLGAQGCLWTDMFLHKPEIKKNYGAEFYCDYFTLPRAAALAEVTWTPRELRNWNEFQKRMAVHYLRYSALGWHYRLPLPEVKSVQTAEGSFQISATSPVLGGSVRYTVDGSNPTAASPELVANVSAPSMEGFRAITVAPDVKTMSLVYKNAAKVEPFAAFGKSIGEWKSGKIGNGTPIAVEFDATGLIDSNGVYQVTFAYTRGAHALKIDKIELYRNRDLITSDVHSGFAGSKVKDNVYTIKVDAYQTGAAFKVHAYIYGDTGDDSNGVVLIKKK